jgi:hypothetical protein
MCPSHPFHFLPSNPTLLLLARKTIPTTRFPIPSYTLPRDVPSTLQASLPVSQYPEWHSPRAEQHPTAHKCHRLATVLAKNGLMCSISNCAGEADQRTCFELVQRILFLVIVDTYEAAEEVLPHIPSICGSSSARPSIVSYAFRAHTVSLTDIASNKQMPPVEIYMRFRLKWSLGCASGYFLFSHCRLMVKHCSEYEAYSYMWAIL